MLSIINHALETPVTLREVKNHLRIDHNYEDEYLEIIINGGVKFIENHIQKTLITKTYQLINHRSNSETLLQSIPLPMGPVGQIISVNRLVGTQKVAIKRYFLDTKHSVNYLECSGDYPVVEITYTAGYGLKKDVPCDIKQALLLQIAEFYEKRENSDISKSNLIDSILTPYKTLTMA
jgi:uncharacterized phiE125 gp8 family phage protein